MGFVYYWVGVKSLREAKHPENEKKMLLKDVGYVCYP